MLRQALLLLAFASLAGCAAPADPVEPSAKADAPWHSEGAFFVEPSQGSGLATVEIPFLVNGTGRAATADVTVGSRYGPLDLPRSTAYVEARILDAAGNVLAQARRNPGGEPTLRLEARDVPEGPAKLVLGIGGGSDEEANGDHVAYVLDAR